MAEGTYEYECERAELLGVAPPKRADWEEAERVRKENELAEQMTEIDIQDEKVTEGTSKMEDITNILSITQMRLNKFKKVCGSLTNLMKIMGNDGATSETDKANQSESEQQTSNAVDDEAGQSSDAGVAGQSSDAGAAGGAAAGGPAVNRPQDVQQKIRKGSGALDSLLAKTENAHITMAHQNKQMKSFFK